MGLPVVADAAEPLIGQKKIRRLIAFSVNASQLGSLDEILAKTGAGRSYNVECTDGTEWPCKSADDLLRVLDHPNRIAVKLTAATSWRHIPGVRLTLDAKDTFNSVECELIAPERDLYFFAQALEAWISDTRQWYTPASSLPGRVVVALLAALCVPICVSALGLPASFAPSFAGGLVFGFVVQRLAHRLFPTGEIAVGAGATKARRLAEVRKLLLVTVLLGGLALPLVRSFLFR